MSLKNKGARVALELMGREGVLRQSPASRLLGQVTADVTGGVVWSWVISESTAIFPIAIRRERGCLLAGSLRRPVYSFAIIFLDIQSAPWSIWPIVVPG